MRGGPTRRDILAGAATLALMPGAARAETVLRAGPAMARLLPEDAPETPVWAYEGTVPGPEYRVAQGARVVRRLVNGLEQATSVHWHGIRLDNAMDGVAGLTQAAVEPGGEFLYDFVAPDAGTYWYHPHNRTFEQMARGLYGPLIVEEAAPPDVDRDLVLMLDDWRLTREGAVAGDFGQMHDRSHAGRIGNWVTVNGVGEFRQGVRAGERLRLRLINAANARVFTLGLRGMTGWVVALDGMPLETPEAAGELVLAPAQRIDLIVDVADAEEALIYSVERDGGYVIAAFPVSGTGPARTAPVTALAPNPVAPLGDLNARPVAEMRMDGGAMGRMGSARMNGRETGIEELVRAGMAWSLAGDAGMPETPFLAASLGETCRIALVNDTAWPHAMHLHGHHFREIIAPGRTGPLRDTLLVDRRERREIAFVADNPGDWLLHCHMLEHADAGMMNWVRVG